MEAIFEIKNIIGLMSFLPFEVREEFGNELELISKSDRGVHHLFSLLDCLQDGVVDPAIKAYINRVKLKLLTGLTLFQILGEAVEEA
jgi:hypothetical protein